MKLPFSKIKSLFTKARDFLAPRKSEPPAPKIAPVEVPPDKRPGWLIQALARMDRWNDVGLDYEARAEAKRVRRRARPCGSSS